MTLHRKDSEGVTIVELEGRINSSSAPDVEQQLMAVVESGSSRILIDLNQVDYISSAGLQVFLVLAKLINAKGGELRLCAANPLVREVMEISGFTLIIAVHESQAEATGEFN